MELTKSFKKEIKKSNGIYFTPYEIVKETIKNITCDNVNYFKNILEPSCGSCQFIDIIDSELNFETLYGVEKNEQIFKEINKIKFKNNVKLLNLDFLDFSPDSDLTFDLIIGNPPYFVIPKKGIQSEYLKYFDGRPNIYSLFLIKCLKLLSVKGILAFVLPKNFLNCIYYNKLRKEIYSNYELLAIIDHSDKKYIETDQDTCVIILQNNNKNKNNDTFTIIKNSIYIFNTPENIKKLNNLYLHSNTLSSLGYTVNIGNIVWNQVKNKLTDDSSKTLLIYSSDVKNKLLVPQRYSNSSKKNYINLPGTTDKCLVINRGYGTGKYKFSYCIINSRKEYLIENHLIVIKSDNNNNNYEVLVKSFENEKTSEFIELMFGNNAINCQELLHLFPIY
jgi:16S rRNA A1518/A1519 N6-dimethyltransferase RsmA/KsgA/DIM1 with predicted DNA glycosylase/AP lyase activity